MDWAQWWQSLHMPWGNGWENAPWMTGGWPMGNEESMVGQNWLNTILPWYQAQAQTGQWQETFDWTQAMDQWSQQFQEGQQDWQQQVDTWQKALQEQQLVQNEELANIAAFGKRWKPNTRWM